MRQTRRSFIRSGLVATGLGLTGLHACVGRGTPPAFHPALGPLRPARDETTGLNLLNLPDGYRYRTMAWAGETMSDGFPAPQRTDGMGVVRADDHHVTLVRNHELRGSSGAIGRPETAWDVTGGGTTTLRFDRATERLESSHVSLGGTVSNCAGGVTPWGTWLSCEESVLSPDLAHHGIQSRQRYYGLGNARRSHGWVFEVDPAGATDPQPITGMGQFYHEAAAVDPDSGIVYLTEDRGPDAGLYRYIPTTPGSLGGGGQLQMLRVEGYPRLTHSVPIGQAMRIGWVTIDNPAQGNSPGTHDEKGVVNQGLRAGATAFMTLEGCALRDGLLYFTSKAGGAAGKGVVFCLDLVREEITVVYESQAGERFSGPDNLVFSPNGALVVCEDRLGRNLSGQFLAGLAADGSLFALAQINPELAGRYADHDLATTARISEWAGVCFAPDGAWMFANIFRPGVTVAITGPWGDGPV
ncbi:MAG: DUF839 domain-containing protein [Xanthomonadales bacterium]|nr:DUF839 domain-containing protein [Xanthomonadales bacterium]